MRAEILASQFAITLYCAAFSRGLVAPRQGQRQPEPQNEHHHHPKAAIATSLSRRRFGILASASLSSLVVTVDGTNSCYYSARADIVEVLNQPIGSPNLLNDLRNEVTLKPTPAVPQQATKETSKEWALQPPMLVSDLGTTRIGNDSILPLPNALPFANQDTFYPAMFVGDWNVKATLQKKTFPFGAYFLPSRALEEGSPYGEKVGDSSTYLARYLPISSSGETFSIADRAFNLLTRNSNSSYDFEQPIIPDSIRWDPNKDATKLAFRRVPENENENPTQTEVTVELTGHKTEDLTRTMRKNSRVFAYAERSRVITTTSTTSASIPKKEVVEENDCEVVTEFRNIGPETIQAVSRVAVYLRPNQGALWSKVKGKAVALYDYELVMQRQRE